MSDSIDERRVNLVLANTLGVLWWTGYAVAVALWYIGYAVLYILHLLYRPIAFALLPVFYFGQFLTNCVALPFRLIVAFEDLFIFLGIAAIVGAFGGVAIRFVFAILRGALQLDAEPAPLGRSIKEYREDRRRAKARADGQLLSSGSSSPIATSTGSIILSDSSRRPRRQRGLLAQTIMEEEDSDF